MTTETWRPVVGWEGLYEVSDHGRVKSLARCNRDRLGRTRPVRERILRPGTSHHGYQVVMLSDGGRQEMKRVHCLVARAFLGSVPPGHEVAHNDGDPRNCHLSNLRYATPSENSADRLLHDTHNRGSRHGMAILTEPQVLQIVALLDAGFTQRSIAAAYGVARFTISEIEQGANWGWLTGRTSHRPVRRSRVLVSAA